MTADIRTDCRLRKRSHAVAFLAYVVTLFSMATIGVIAPLVGKLASAADVPVAQVGLAIALYSSPSALFSWLVGPLSDRWGACRLLAGASLLGAVAALYLYSVTSLLQLRIGLLASGVAFTGIVVSAPALIMRELGGESQSRWLSLWSTYGPAGFAIGLLLTVASSTGADWRAGLLVAGGAMMVGAVLLAWLSSSQRPARGSGSQVDSSLVGGLAAVGTLVRNPRIVRLAIAIALPTGISYGTSLLMPSYFSSIYGVTLAAASGVVALAKLVIVVAGGLVSGWLVAQRVAAKPLFTALGLAGLVAQVVLFFPGSGFVPAVMALGVWLFVYAAMCGIAMALLPGALVDERSSGAASGLVSQAISCTSFLGPVIYFSHAAWQDFVAIAAVGLAISVAILPGASRHLAPASAKGTARDG